MSYIQIQLGGELRGLKFNQGANEIFWRKIDIALASETQQIYAMFYAGLVLHLILPLSRFRIGLMNYF
jgi:hypothetical protein